MAISSKAALGASIQFTTESLDGVGAIKGKNCTISDVSPIEGGSRITFLWTADSGTQYNTYVDVMDGAQGEPGEPGEQGEDGKGIKNTYVDENSHFIVVYDDDTEKDCGEITVVSPQKDVLPEPSESVEGKIYQYMGETTETLINGYFYKCVSDGEEPATYSWVETQVQAGGSGDSTLTADVTSNLAVGAIASGTTLPEGTTFTEFAQKLLITEIAPTTSFSASGSGVKEVGTSVTPTLTLTINSAGTGTPIAIKFYDGLTLLDTQDYVSGTNTYTYTMSPITTTKTVKGVLEYKKSDNTTATVEKSASYTFVMASYYGAVTTAPTDKAGIIALTKNVKNTKAQTATFTLSNQRSCYCYPASFGNLTSIKDANNFEYLSSYTKTNVTVDDVSYNVYTLTDAVTASGFKQVYA